MANFLQFQKLLIVTTHADNSLLLFEKAAKKLNIHFSVLYFEDDPVKQNKVLQQVKYDVIYFRDPFNTRAYDELEISDLLQNVKESQKQAYFVDTIDSFEKLLIEDKWQQYSLLKSFMPHTAILKSTDQFIAGRTIIKKRISARSKDIHFEIDKSFLNGSYIIQPLLDILKEYRVYLIRGEIINPVVIRSSKSASTKVKAKEIEDITRECKEFATEVATHLHDVDFIGLDIAKTTAGKFYLLEANRSCQFLKYTQLSGINLAEILLKKLHDR